MTKRYLKMSVLAVPSVDVFFLVVMFIFLSDSFIYQSAIKVELPAAVPRYVVSEDNPVVTLTPGEGIFLNGRKVSKEGLSTLLGLMAQVSHKKNKETLLIIRADQSISHRYLVEIIDEVRSSGITHIAIATEPAK